MAITGRVDGMAGPCIIGWAFSDGDRESCEILILDEEGLELASGRAALHRPDLVSAGVGRTDLAFRIAVENPAQRRMLHVFANGVELTGSPITTGAGVYDSDFAIVQATVTGWITERVAHFAPPLIQVMNQHGSVVGAARAELVADPSDPRHSHALFSIELDDQCFGCGEMRLRILADGVTIGEQLYLLELSGNLDSINNESCAGWLFSSDAPDRVLKFDVFQNGVFAGQGLCKLSRDDVRAVHPRSNAPGFSVTLYKPGHSILETTTVSLRFRGSKLELFDGPYMVGSGPAAVVTAQRAAWAAHDGLRGLDAAGHAVVQVALREFMDKSRKVNGFVARRQPTVAAAATQALLTVIVPVYRDVEITRVCIQSVLAHRDSAIHHLVLINDASPEAEMADLLNGFGAAPNVFVLTNRSNLGFVKSVNRCLSFALGGDVLLLNADTLLFAGGLEEMCRVIAAPGIGTVTALSNNATIFSYPHSDLSRETLEDISWPDLARIALDENTGRVIDVPTGHGFCMLIKGDVLRRVGFLDEAYGRGYGEENDFCMRAANLGYRNVAAAGVLVVHRESTSFAEERTTLLAENLPKLRMKYPEYEPLVHRFQEQDGLRRARWALDRARLYDAVQEGQPFILLVTNALGGGTVRAVEDIEAASGDETAVRLTLCCQESGLIELRGERPILRAAFAPDEMAELFALLAVTEPRRLMVHQLLGFPAEFIRRIGEWARELPSFYYVHDFYPLCPRVTMIDAINEFCDIADTVTCARCVKLGGAHPASRLTELTPAAHRALFAVALPAFRHIVAPSANAARYLRRALPDMAVRTIPHPEPVRDMAIVPRAGTDDEIVLLGAIGAHKGSAKLLEIARRAQLTNPGLMFRVIGYTDIDAALVELGNVIITGSYKSEELPALVAKARGRFALFLQAWPETYSYTLSEAARFGFIPLVPDVGAPAERVRASGFGVVFPFPVDPPQVLNLIEELTAGLASPYADATPARLYSDPHQIQRTRDLLQAEGRHGAAASPERRLNRNGERARQAGKRMQKGPAPEQIRSQSGFKLPIKVGAAGAVERDDSAGTAKQPSTTGIRLKRSVKNA